MTINLGQNALALQAEFKHLLAVIELQGKIYSENGDIASLYQYHWPLLDVKSGPYAWLVNKINKQSSQEVAFAQRLVLLLALVPKLQPQLLDGLLVRRPDGQPYTEYGNASINANAGFRPSVQTALFLLAGNDLSWRMRWEGLFSSSHTFFSNNILELEAKGESRSFLEKELKVSEEYFSIITTGQTRLPDFSQEFPASKVTTKLEWEDLVLPPSTLKQIKELQNWLQYQPELDKIPELARKVKPGYRVIFHGPSGTGKTLTASLLGKYAKQPVFRVDLSQVVSKYIGETEKNLSKLFNKAEHKNWILFFDEADALFGKRSNTQNAHDKYANQETAYLLQRIETYNGLVILASNFKSNIDKAFTRRFQAMIEFPKPKYAERLRLWEKAFPAALPLAEGIDLRMLAQKYELTGAHIVNIVHTCCLNAVAGGVGEVGVALLRAAVEKEYLKEGRLFGG